MAQHPFLKSIRPVNLLSFGPNTEEIELRPLNILIGPNGSGKSNLIEILALLSKLPDKDPWSAVIQTGGALEWIWKGETEGSEPPELTIITTGETNTGRILPRIGAEKPLFYSIVLREKDGNFEVARERFVELEDGISGTMANYTAFERDEAAPLVPTLPRPEDSEGLGGRLSPRRSILSMVGAVPNLSTKWPRMKDFEEAIESFAFYREWTFGASSEIRNLQPVGLDSYRLAGDSRNLAQVLKAMRDRGNSIVFERLLELLHKFYEPVKDVDTELVGTHLRIMIKEEGLGSRTPAERLSDGTLRWLMLLIILLDPTPPPVICIDEPELGLHPDAIHTLADLLVEASKRTQLIITTHSDALLDAFTDTPDIVCVCEKVEGSTVIQRLDKERLKVWLDDYSLGQLWAKGEIGGNRW
jgi:predicted ATPase